MEAIDRTQPSERRSKVRYPVTMYVRYRTIDRDQTVYGFGRLVNMSSGGILVKSERRMPVGKRLEINITWPFLLDGVVPLQLIALGKVVRSFESGFAVTLAKCQFRTMSRKIHSTSDSDGIALSRP
jgi:PilZ domain